MPKTATAQKKRYYGVIVGRRVGVFNTWEETERSVSGFSGAKHNSFKTYEEALKFVQEGQRSNNTNLAGEEEVSSGGRKFYAVGVGRKVGVFGSWDECKQQVRDFEGAKFKGFWKKREAEEWVVEKVEEQKKKRRTSAAFPIKRKTSSGSSSSSGQQRVERSMASSFNLPHPGQRSTANDILLKKMKDLSLFGTMGREDGYA
ncbi:hypothetical protein BDY24DRAFT_157003 [Mrakia frigida]|uniref:uncharacterized protein n=1 Tax=Mrakia frigida TaxID=29902 RepID=UPI003FCC1C12